MGSDNAFMDDYHRSRVGREAIAVCPGKTELQPDYTKLDPYHAFDQRPGDPEATRQLTDGHAFMVVGARKPDGWRAAVQVSRALDPAEMRKLAFELTRMADLFDERVDW